MARIQFGSLVTGIAGKLGGHLFGNSLGGATIHNLPRTSRSKKLWGYIKRQQHINVATVVAAWKDLSDAERAAWTSYAVTFYTTLSLYGKHTLTGYACFSRVNHNILLTGNSIITVPVPKVGLTDPGSITINSLSPTVFTVAYVNSLGPDEYFLIAASGTNSVTLIPQVKGLKVIQAFSSSVASPLDIYNNYAGLKGAPLSTGWVTVRAEVINATTGERGMLKRVSHVVA